MTTQPDTRRGRRGSPRRGTQLSPGRPRKMASARVRVPDAGHRRISEPASVEIRTNADFRLLPEHLQCRWARRTGKSRTTILGERDIRIVHDAPESIRAALERIGRTEDLQFSP